MTGQIFNIATFPARRGIQHTHARSIAHAG
jgi:hypothetical protein